jgi:hypothetical protein
MRAAVAVTGALLVGAVLLGLLALWFVFGQRAGLGLESTVEVNHDGRTWRVVDANDPARAAALLSELSGVADALVAHMTADPDPAQWLPDERRARRLRDNWRACNARRTCLREISTTGDALAWILGKNIEVGICLRDFGRPWEFDADERPPDGRKGNNTARFVLIHELAHSMSIEYNHCAEFQDNFSALLDIAAAAGLWNAVDYHCSPNRDVYCGGVVSAVPPDTGECETGARGAALPCPFRE